MTQLILKQQHPKPRRIATIGAILATISLAASAFFVAPHAEQIRTATNQVTGEIALHQDSPAVALKRLQSMTTQPLLAARSDSFGTVTWLESSDHVTPLPYVAPAIERGNPEALARGFLDENRGLFMLGSAQKDLQLLELAPDTLDGFQHARFGQIFQGLPVYGRQLFVHVDASNHVLAVNGQYVPSLVLNIEPTVDRAEAEDLALRNLRERQLDGAEAATALPSVLGNRTQLMVYVDVNDHPTLVWMVKMLTRTPLGQWTFFVNARRPVVTHAIDANEILRRRQTFTAQATEDLPGRLLADEGNRTADPIGQAAHDGAGKVYDFYSTNFKRDSLDGRGMPLISTVHFGSDPQEQENAAWIGEAKQMVFGDGGRMFRPLAYGLDVIGHEFTHGVVESTANLVYESQSGALNESYADVFGVLISGANWDIGRGTVKSPPFPVPYLRSMSDPNAGGYYNPRNPLAGVGQPATMNEYANLEISRRADNGGVHINSGVPNHAAYYVGQSLGKDKLAQIWYRALTNYLTPRSNFADAANATIRSAQELYGADGATVVRTAWSQVGIGAGASSVGPAAPTTQPTTQTPAQPSAPETLPAGCVNVVKNGGFESQDTWKQNTKGNTGLIESELPHTGTGSAWLGGQDQEPLQAIYQDIAIPANATTVSLRYFRLIHKETGGVLGFFTSPARFATQIANPQSTGRAVIEQLTSDDADDAWTQQQFDISQLAGHSIRLLFTAENPRQNTSSFFVDDVGIIACTTGTAPAAPQPRANDVVYLGGKLVDADTGRGVPGAQVIILRAGLSASAVAAQDNVNEQDILTTAVTDSNGQFQTESAIARNKQYSVIIVARNYRPVIADNGVTLPSNANNPFLVNATLRRSR